MPGGSGWISSPTNVGAWVQYVYVISFFIVGCFVFAGRKFESSWPRQAGVLEVMCGHLSNVFGFLAVSIDDVVVAVFADAKIDSCSPGRYVPFDALRDPGSSSHDLGLGLKFGEHSHKPRFFGVASI